MEDKPQVTITAKRHIAKYAEGAVPGVDEPIEIIEKTDVFTGEEALKIIKDLGGDVNVPN